LQSNKQQTNKIKQDGNLSLISSRRFRVNIAKHENSTGSVFLLLSLATMCCSVGGVAIAAVLITLVRKRKNKNRIGKNKGL
jgi:hypothetical protein